MSRPRTTRKPPRLKAAPSAPAPAIRVMDLYGRAREGSPPILWDRARPVMPISAFTPSSSAPWMIKSGHFVIDEDGVAITVHCGNARASPWGRDGGASLKLSPRWGELSDGRPSLGRINPSYRARDYSMGGQLVTEEEQARMVELLKAARRRFRNGTLPPFPDDEED